MEKLNQSAANLEGLINNTPLTSAMRNQLIEDLKSLYELAKKSLDVPQAKTTLPEVNPIHIEKDK